jgi:Sigma-70 region 2
MHRLPSPSGSRECVANVCHRVEDAVYSIRLSYGECIHEPVNDWFLAAMDAMCGDASRRAELDSDQTNPTLLGQVRECDDHPAWKELFDRYNPLLCVWCHGFALERDELCQRIRIKLMTRMPTFRYDPGRGFRRWLRRLFRSRAIDLMRARRASRVRMLSELELEKSLVLQSNRGERAPPSKTTSERTSH